MKKAVISHSWSHNMGDAAMLRAIADILRGISPDLDITALVSHPDYSAARCRGAGVRLEGWPWPVGNAGLAEKLAYYPAVFMGNMLSAAIFRISGKQVFLMNGRFRAPLSRIFECDVFICPGGDFIGPKYFFLSTFGELFMARMLGKKVVICAQTIGPFSGFFERKLAGFVLGLADLVIAREEPTATHLAELGIGNVRITSDLAFMFPPPPETKRKKRVIISPKRISGEKGKYAEGIRRLSERLSGGLGYEVVFLPSDRYDAAFQAEIASGLPGKVTLVEDVHAPEEIARIMSEAEFVVSSRMHAIILATLSGTPFYAVGDSFKFSAILGQLCEDCTMGIEELDGEGVETILRALRGRKRRAASIRAKFPGVLEKSRANARILREKFAEWGLA
jgi:polysaccharide pyruvyl transferase WcaK-like protein